MRLEAVGSRVAVRKLGKLLRGLYEGNLPLAARHEAAAAKAELPVVDDGNYLDQAASAGTTSG